MKKKSDNEKLLNGALQGLISRLEQTEAFALEQAPEICKQMVMSQILQNVQGAVMSTLASIVGIGLLVFSLQHEVIGSSEPTRYFFVMLLGGIFSLIGICCASDTIREIAYLKQCPKLFLLREFKQLVK